MLSTKSSEQIAFKLLGDVVVVLFTTGSLQHKWLDR